MDGWPQQPIEHEFEQVPGVGDGQGSLVCSSPWARKESDKTKLLNETELNPLQYSDGHELAHGLMNNSRYLPGSLAGWILELPGPIRESQGQGDFDKWYR